jgi:hypothetical protein
VIEGFEALLYGREVGLSCCGGNGRGLVPVQDFEGGVLSISVVSRVMGEFDEGERVGPGLGVDGAEDRKVGLDLLIYPFGRPICLGVEGGGG